MTSTSTSTTTPAAATTAPATAAADLDPADGVHVVLGAGPVGWAIATELAERGAAVRLVTRSGSGPEHRQIERVALDVSSTAGAIAGCADAAVVYGAAQPAYHRWPQEFPGLQAAILAGAEAAGAVYVAVENLYAYGPVDGPMTEDLPLRPITRKGRVRARLAEELVEAHRSGRVRTTAGRASDFFGPHAAGSVVGERFFPPILAGKAVSVLGDPSTRHTFTYAPDLARALVVLGSREEAWGRAWHVPNPETTTIAGFAERASASAGTTGRVRATPTWALRLAGLVAPAARETVEMRYEFEEDFVVDDSAFRAAFGLAATPLDEALEDTVAWWRAHEARG